MVQEIFIPEVLKSVVMAMKVVIPDSDPVSYFDIHYEPGRSQQIIDSLKNMDGTSLDILKYPLIAVLMPISEKNSSSYPEVLFDRIVIAYLTKTSTNSEPVMTKYSSDGVFKTILRPCLREFIKNLAFSVYTNSGDPDSYEYTAREMPSQQPIGQGLSDYVDIIEILKLKATIFSQIKTC